MPTARSFSIGPKKDVIVFSPMDSRGQMVRKTNPKHAIISKARLVKNFLMEKGSFLFILCYTSGQFVGVCVLPLNPRLNRKLVIARRQATINHKDRTCRKTRFIGGEEECSVRNVNRLSDPS